ncbi:MAG: RNA pseudouridine synthase [Verrucomicrobia bacterium]|nr:RNA pseudouridine synthase [Verrucomicrobiota bacterium]
MPKPRHIELGSGESIPILYEDRSVIAIDKPAGWMLVPFSWQKTDRNLQAAISSSIGAGHFWARSRNLKYLRHIHRLDADTTGILLLAKSQGALDTFSDLFESRRMEKAYLAVVEGNPKQDRWTCHLKLAPDPDQIGRMKVEARRGKEAETHFEVLQRAARRTLIEARPVTGRTHQIRIHLAQSGCPIVGDPLYGQSRPSHGSGDGSSPQSPLAHSGTGRPGPYTMAKTASGDTQPCEKEWPLGLRAVVLGYVDPFTHRRIEIRASVDKFVEEFGFKPIANMISSAPAEGEFTNMKRHRRCSPKTCGNAKISMN